MPTCTTITWNEAKALLTGLLASAVVMLLSFNIVTLLPSKVFATSQAGTGIEMATAIALCIGTVLQLAKRITTSKYGRTELDREWKQVFRAALVLATLGAFAAFAVFVMNFLVHSPIERDVYFGAVVTFLFSILISPDTLAAIDHRQENGWVKMLTYVIDRFSLALYVGVYIQINFLEAKEILELDKRNTNGFLVRDQTRMVNGSEVPEVVQWQASDDQANETDYFHQVYDGLKTAAYAILAELVALLFICHVEQWRLQKTRNALSDSLTVSDPSQKPEVDKVQHKQDGLPAQFYTPHDAENGGQRSTLDQWKMITRMDHLVLMLGLVSLAPLVLLVIVHTAGAMGDQVPQSAQVNLLQIVFHAFFSIYLAIVLCYLKPCRMTDCKNVTSSLDIVLLRWSAYGVFLFLTLVLAGLICGPRSTIPYWVLSYPLYVLNAVQAWIQYAVLAHLFSLAKEFQHDRPGLKKLSMHASPILLANAFLWVYNLWQWKSVSFLAFGSEENSPGSLWEIIEAILFPPAIFFRFHSAFLGYMLFHMKSAEWVRSIRRSLTGAIEKSGMKGEVNRGYVVDPVTH